MLVSLHDLNIASALATVNFALDVAWTNDTLSVKFIQQYPYLDAAAISDPLDATLGRDRKRLHRQAADYLSHQSLRGYSLAAQAAKKGRQSKRRRT